MVAGKGLSTSAGPHKFYVSSAAVAEETKGFWESDLKARSTVPLAELSALKTRDKFADNSNAPPVSPGTVDTLRCERWVMSRRARSSMTTQRVTHLHPSVETSREKPTVAVQDIPDE